MIILVALLAETPVSGRYQALVVAGLLFSLAGDVLLMLPSDRFREGLGSFLLAHVIYVAAFTTTGGFQLAPFALVLIAVAGGWMYRTLLPNLGALRLPVAVYVTAIGAMLWQAAGQWLVVDASWAVFALVGAILFAVSDSVLAWDRFHTPIPHRTCWVLGAYFPAQWLIALSVGGG